MDVAKWLKDCYRAMNKDFKPIPTDISTFVQVVDINRDQKVCFNDLQDFVLRRFHQAHNIETDQWQN